MKYVILKTEQFGLTRVWPFIFSAVLVHAEAKDRFMHQIWFETNGVEEPKFLSAGFCNFNRDGTFVCVSGSESIGYAGSPEASEQDTKILTMPDALMGMLL